PNTLEILRSVEAGECFLEVAEGTFVVETKLPVVFFQLGTSKL
ncbi:unnamed protein product, partial [Pocillopora meandrina]